MASGRLALAVYVEDDSGTVHWFTPDDDDVPGWAADLITNPDAWATPPSRRAATADNGRSGGQGGSSGGDQGGQGGQQGGSSSSGQESTGTVVPAPVDYGSWTVVQLKAEIVRRDEGRPDDDKVEVDEPGNKPELVAALQGDDVAAAERSAAATQSGTPS